MKKINHYQGDTLDFHKDVVNSKRNTADDKNKKNRLAGECKLNCVKLQ